MERSANAETNMTCKSRLHPQGSGSSVGTNPRRGDDHHVCTSKLPRTRNRFCLLLLWVGVGVGFGMGLAVAVAAVPRRPAWSGLTSASAYPSREVLSAVAFQAGDRAGGTTAVRGIQAAALSVQQVDQRIWRSARDPGPGGVVEPVDLAVHPDGGWLVLDVQLHRAQSLTSKGITNVVFGGGPGADATDLDGPLGIAVDAVRERVYLADTRNQRIVAYDLDGMHQSTLTEGLQQPEALTLLPDGRVYAYDRGRSALVAHTADGEPDAVVPVQRAISNIAELPSGLATSPRATLFFAAEHPIPNQPNVLYEFRADGETLRPRTLVRWRMRDVSFDAAGEMLLLDGTEHAMVVGLDRDSGEARSRTPLGRGVVALAGGDPGVAHALFQANELGPARVATVDTRSGQVTSQVALPLPDGAWTPGPLRLDARPAGRLLVVDILERLLVWNTDAWGAAPNPSEARVHAAAQARWNGLVGATHVGDASGDLVLSRVRASDTYDDPADPDVPRPGMRVVRLERVGPAEDPSGIVPSARRWRMEVQAPITRTDFGVLVAVEPDTDTGQVVALDAAQGVVLRAALDDGARQSNWPLPSWSGVPGWVDLAIGEEGVVALHAGARRLAVLDPTSGAMTAEVDLRFEALPLRIAARPAGGWIVVTVDRRLHAVDATGTSWATWDLGGSVAQLGAPSDVAVDAEDVVYVADLEDRSVQRLAGWPGAQPTGGRLALPLLRR